MTQRNDQRKAPRNLHPFPDAVAQILRTEADRGRLVHLTLVKGGGGAAPVVGGHGDNCVGNANIRGFQCVTSTELSELRKCYSVNMYIVGSWKYVMKCR